MKKNLLPVFPYFPFMLPLSTIFCGKSIVNDQNEVIKTFEYNYKQP
ncbi:hypothetical protein [Empedobacter brevis]|nr:hypothetical protein [Empedobacter brevis]